MQLHQLAQGSRGGGAHAALRRCRLHAVHKVLVQVQRGVGLRDDLFQRVQCLRIFFLFFLPYLRTTPSTGIPPAPYRTTPQHPPGPP